MGWFSLLAPFASLLFTAAKAWDVAVPLKDVSYAWAILPILIWVLIAYYRRWEASDRLTELLEPRITLGFDSEKCVRDVYFSNGELARYVGVIVTGPKEVSISNVSVFLHSVEYIDEDNRSTRIDIEGAPVLELTRSGGPVVAHNPKTLHAGREAQVNVLNCTSSPYPADIHLCSPEQLIREEGAMGIGGDYRVIVRGSGDGVGAFAEIVLKISWNGIKPDSLSAEVWPSESARDYVHAAT